MKWVDTLRLNAFGSLIDFMSWGGGGVLKPFEPLKSKGALTCSECALSHDLHLHISLTAAVFL